MMVLESEATTSAAYSLFSFWVEPRSMLELASIRKKIFRFLSSSNSFTIVFFDLTVAFQSIIEASSIGV